MKVISEEQKAKISESLRKRWASGTRKPNPEGYGARGGEVRQSKMADGTMRKRVMTTEQAKAAQSCVDMDRLVAALRKNAKARLGVAMTTPLSAKCETHHAGKWWVVANKARGVTLEGRNLSNMVREHSHMFDPEDVHWTGTRCRATKGLRNLFQEPAKNGRPPPNSWKGWVAVRKI